MHHRRPTQSHDPQPKIMGMNDLVACAQRQVPPKPHEELWSARMRKPCSWTNAVSGVPQMEAKTYRSVQLTYEIANALPVIARPNCD